MGSYFYLLAFGSNVGEREVHCKNGLERLAEFGVVTRQTPWKTTVPLRSEDYVTDDHGDYLNFVCEFQSTCSPIELLNCIEKIEDAIGHERLSKWKPRCLDIDILFCAFGEQGFEAGMPVTLNVERLQIPHVGFLQREFLREMVMNGLGITPAALETHFAESRKQR